MGALPTAKIQSGPPPLTTWTFVLAHGVVGSASGSRWHTALHSKHRQTRVALRCADGRPPKAYGDLRLTVPINPKGTAREATARGVRGNHESGDGEVYAMIEAGEMLVRAAHAN
jgi:hypothetical protein